jgi:putative transcriptional regulator
LRHHPAELQPLDALLASYAAGQLSPALYALIGAHLVLCGKNRAYVAALEAMAAGELLFGDPAPIGGREAKLSAIFDCPQVAAPALVKTPLPRSLSHFIGQPFDAIRWRNILPGIRECLIDKRTDEAATLIWIEAGHRIPAHCHEGTEVTLVLQGGFSDSTGHYCRGDIAIADANVDHGPIADGKEDCLCFSVTDGRMRLTGPVGKLAECVFRPGH